MAALVFGTDDHAPDPFQRDEIMAALQYVGGSQVLIDQAAKNIVENVIGRQVVHVGPVGLQLGAGRAVDDVFRDDPAGGAVDALGRPILVGAVLGGGRSDLTATLVGTFAVLSVFQTLTIYGSQYALAVLPDDGEDARAQRALPT